MENRDYWSNCTSVYCKWGDTRFSENSLKNELKYLCPNGKVTKCAFDSPEKFTATVKCHVKEIPLTFQGQYADRWIESFSTFTGTAWTAQTGFTELKKLLHQKVYTCDHHDRKKLTNENIPNTAKNEQQECSAEITFGLNTTQAKKLKGLNMTIKVNSHHSHRLYDPEVLKAGNLSIEMETKLEQYFIDGSTAVAAKYFHELSLLDEHPDNPEILSDKSFNPSLMYIIYMYNKFQDYDDDLKDLYDIMQEKKEYYDYHGSTFHFPGDINSDLAEFSIQTPAMKRTMRELGFATVFIDTIDIPEGPIVTYVSVPTKIGAMPIGCNVITPKGRHTSGDGYESLRLTIYLDAQIDFEPSMYFINDESVKCRLSFGPGEDRKKLWAMYDMCKSTWTWLNDDDNKIDKTKRHELMVLINNLFQSSKEKAEQLYKEFTANAHVTQCPTLKEYLADWWSKREEWVCDANDRQMNNSLVAMSFRCLRELVLKHCRGFNLPQMVDVVGKILENHQRRILQSFIENRDVAKTYTKYLTKANVSKDGEKLLFDGSEVRKVAEHEYQIINQNNPSKYITLRTDTMFCDCLNGKRGEFCAHLVAILDSVPEVMQIPELTKGDKYLFTFIRGQVDSKGEPKPQARASPVRFNSEEDCEEGLEDIRGVAVPMHDARGLVPGGHESSYEEEEIRDLEEEYPLGRPRRRYNRRRLVPERRNGRRPIRDPFNEYFMPIRRPIPDRFNDYSRLDESPIGYTGKITIPLKVSSYKLLANKEQQSSTSASINDIPSTSNSDIATKAPQTPAWSKAYDTGLKLLNNEFERLNKFFSKNPNDTNFDAMSKLAKDLTEVKPEDTNEANDELDENLSNRKAVKRRHSSQSNSWDAYPDFDYYSDGSDDDIEQE